MKNYLRHSATILALCCLFFTSACKKGTEDVTPAGSSIVGNAYRLSAVTLTPPIDVNNDGKLDSNLMELMEPCELDNTITFRSGGMITIDSGPTKCADEPVQGTGGTWTYDEASNTLRMSYDDEPSDVSEWEVSNNGATIQGEGGFELHGVTYTMRITWKRV